MVLRINLTVFRTTDLALCFVLAGRFPAGVVVLNRNDLFRFDCKAIRRFCTDRYLKTIFFSRIAGRAKLNRIFSVFERCANIAADPFKLIACGNEFASLWECKAEDIILRPANSVCTADHDFGNGLFRCFVATELALLPILAVFALPNKCMSIFGYSSAARRADGGIRAGGLCRAARVVAGRPLGRQRKIRPHRPGEIIGIRAQIPPGEDISRLGRVVGPDGRLARLDDLLGIDPAQLTVLIDHGDRLAVGGGDVGGHAGGAGGLDGLVAELCVLFQSQPVIKCAAGDMALRVDGFVKAAAGDVAPKVFSYVPIQVIFRDCHGDAAVEAAAPDVARAVDIAGEDRGRLPVRVVDGVGGLELNMLTVPVPSHIHRALHPAAVGIEEAAGIVDGIGRFKVHVDRSAVFDGAFLLYITSVAIALISSV